jgi:hypothetical protein
VPTNNVKTSTTGSTGAALPDLQLWHLLGCRSDFTTLPHVLLQEHHTVVLLLEGVVVSWSLAMDERGGHEGLRRSGRRSIIPYVHGRTELYCPSLYEPKPAFSFAPEKWRLPKHFIAKGRAATMSPEARQVAPRWLKPYTAARVLMARSSK